MTTLWRLSNSDNLTGTAVLDGRWAVTGAPVILLDASPAAAICARLALAEVPHPHQLPRTYRLLEINVPARCITTPPPALLRGHDTEATRAFGQRWLDNESSLLLRVPSMAGAMQFLLNSVHPDMALCTVKRRAAYPFDGLLEGLSLNLADGSDWLAREPARAACLYAFPYNS